MKINKKEYSMGGYNELAAALKAYAEGGEVSETDPKKAQLGAVTVTAEKPDVPTRKVKGWESEDAYNAALSYYNNLFPESGQRRQKAMAQIAPLLERGNFQKAAEIARQLGGKGNHPETFDGFGLVGYASWNEGAGRAEMVSPEEAAEIERIMKENPDSPAARKIQSSSYVKNPFGERQWNY